VTTPAVALRAVLLAIVIVAGAGLAAWHLFDLAHQLTGSARASVLFASAVVALVVGSLWRFLSR
jgi:hypothetical protein